jgi:4-aminobutyrate aminotransferase
MSAHADLLARHRKVLPSWMILYYEEPIALVDGEGRHVTDAEGNTYLDFFGGILVTMSGHRVPQVVEAIKAQADRLLHTSPPSFGGRTRCLPSEGAITGSRIPPSG